MKTLIICFLLLDLNAISAQKDTFIVKKDSSNLVIFVTDFVSNTFEGSSIYHLPKNNTDSLLFRINYHAPSDFGSIEFIHLPSDKMVFRGTIVWDGCGKILIPDTLIYPHRLSVFRSPVKRPELYQNYSYCEELNYFISNPVVMAAELYTYHGVKKECAEELEKYKSMEVILDRVWKSINNLKIVYDLSQQNCKIGFYLYTPSVGMFDATRAKWITFIYLN